MNKAVVALQTIWSGSSYHRLKQFIDDKKPDLVHFHNTFPLISPAAYYACQDLGIPVIQTLDNQRLMCPAATFYRDGKLCLECLGKTPPWPGILHACYHNSHLHTAVVASMLSFHRLIRTWQTKVDVFLCSTHFYRDLFVEAGFPADKLEVMPHFVWNQAPLDSRFGSGDYALFVGRLDPEKGIQTLLEAWRHLDFPLKIRGSGPLGESLQKFVSDHKLDNIEFVGRLEEGELSALMSNARFLIMPSEGYYETFGMVIIESYARGVPVIASNIGVAPELVFDGRTGLLFEAGSALDLSRKASWLWEHPAEASNMGRNGFALYEERFTPERCYEKLVEVYERLIDLK
jgi:glycosyltransferase involved in cell wall biosynthesis